MRERCRRCRGTLQPKGTGRPPRYCSPACRQADYRKRNRPRSGILAVMGASRSVEWPTDPQVYARLDAEFGPFTLDPCATAENAKCPAFFTRAEDGLVQTWTGRVFMNPPYGREIGRWMRKAWEASQTTAELVVCLVPARVDTAWWHDWAGRGETRLLRGRLKFGEAKSSAPFPSAVVVFRNAKTAPEALRNEAG
jgi:phage N-6-adenine-methyltransferase